MSRFGPPLLILGLGLVFFAPLWLSPGQILYSDHSDVLAEHLPAKRFLVREVWATGELPLWCPYLFCGSPFVHDIQVGIFYPPHLLLYLAGEQNVGVVLSWLVVGHVVLAGWLMYAYARTQNLGVAASLVAAVGYMFAGKWLLHLLGGGHYIVVGLAWLPLAVLCLEQAIKRASVVWATGAGVVFAMLVLGTHPQWTFYAGLLLAVWSLGEALFSPGQSRWVGLLKWLGFGAWAAVVAGSLIAVQFLPTLEAARQSMRSDGVPPGSLIQDGLLSLWSFFGPALVTSDKSFSSQWEQPGGFTLLWVAAAAAAPFLAGGKVRFQAGVAVAVTVFALGACVLFQSLPGFSTFRQHSRALVVMGFPVALLAAVTVQALLTPTAEPAAKKVARRALLITLIAFVLLTGSRVLLLTLGRQSLTFHPYWLTLLLTVPVWYWVLRPGGHRPWLLGAVLLIDLVALTWPLVRVNREADIYTTSACVEYLTDKRGDLLRVLDRDDTDQTFGTPLGTGAPLAPIQSIQAVRGYTPLDVLRFKEYLAFVGDDGSPQRPFTPGNPLAFPTVSDFPLKNPKLLDLLGVGYRLQPTAAPLENPDAWVKELDDPDPRGFDLNRGGTRALPPYTVYRNRNVLPRAFVVGTAEPLPERTAVLARLKTLDPTTTVLIEADPFDPAWPSAPNPEAATADILEYTPNRVRVGTNSSSDAFLVLTDVWFPGWTATVDGQPTPVYRADYLFRAVRIPAGSHIVEFTFLPESYQRGRWISLVGLGVAAGVGVLGLIHWLFRRKKPTGGAVPS